MGQAGKALHVLPGAQGWSTATTGPTHQLLPPARPPSAEARSPRCQAFIPSQPEKKVPAAGLLPWGEAQQPRNHPSTPWLPRHRRYRGDTNTSSAQGFQHVLSVKVAFQNHHETNSQTLLFFFLTSTGMEKFPKYQKYNPRHFSCPMKQQKSSLKKCILIYLLSLFVFLVPCGRTQEFFVCNKLGIFCYFSVLIQ